MILQPQEFQEMPLWEQFLPGVQNPKVPMDDQIPPSALDRPKGEAAEVTGYGYGGGVY